MSIANVLFRGCYMNSVLDQCDRFTLFSKRCYIYQVYSFELTFDYHVAKIVSLIQCTKFFKSIFI